MVSTRSRAAEVAGAPMASTPAPSPLLSDDGYERRRDERIRENLERLKKLGIVDLALTLKTNRRGAFPSRSYTKPSPSNKKLSSPLPSRRSSRLQSVPSVSYSELTALGKRGREVVVEEEWKEEVYTEDHEKLLGKCEKEWVLFVDGYGADGLRIYDRVRGKTCHQCRQKTLGHRTRCSNCDMLQGQFCGDCLFMRYGENVLEANENPDWVCPVCRGICNCSFCRLKKGWAPTGTLYRKARNLGFKSVAHYLIQTKRVETKKEEEQGHHPASAKRSLKFAENADLESNSSIEDETWGLSLKNIMNRLK